MVEPDYKHLYKTVCELYSKSNFSFGEWDETFYTLRVFETCKRLLDKSRLKVDEEVVLTAAIFHDIGITKINQAKNIEKEWNKHPKYGVPITREILRKEGFDNDFIEKVVCLVKHHDARPHIINMIRSDELKILQDAVLLANMGISGYVRSFLCSGDTKRPIIENLNNITTHKKNNKLDKQLLLRFNLGVSKKIAKKLFKESSYLTNKLTNLTDSELLY
jgi:putative nucleotidyltransferase with HDIG domain